MANPWFRMYSEFAFDPKVQMMSEQYQRRFIMLLCLRCVKGDVTLHESQCNGDVTLHETEVAFQLRISTDEWAETKCEFVRRGLIDASNNPVAWDRRQYISDSSAARVAKHRNAKKTVTCETESAVNFGCNDDVTLQKRRCNGDVTSPDAEKESELKKQQQQQQQKRVRRKKSADDPLKDCPVDCIIEMFAENFPGLAKPVSMSGKRGKLLADRWSETMVREKILSPDDALVWWRRFFTFAAQSSFLQQGTKRSNGSLWLPDLPWMLDPDNFANIIEGKYHDVTA